MVDWALKTNSLSLSWCACVCVCVCVCVRARMHMYVCMHLYMCVCVCVCMCVCVCYSCSVKSLENRIKEQQNDPDLSCSPDDLVRHRLLMLFIHWGEILTDPFYQAHKDKLPVLNTNSGLDHHADE